MRYDVPFEMAVGVFADPLLFTKPDPRYDDRWISAGEVQGTLLVVVHADVETATDGGQIHTRVRIISARVADAAERRASRDDL